MTRRTLGTLLLLALTVHVCDAAGCCPDAWTAFQGSCYLSHHTASNFHDAEDKCKELGGRLIHIETNAENTFIRNFLGELKAPEHWIGLQDGVIEGVWKWHGTDNVASFTDWGTNQPNGGTVANCAAMFASFNYHWVDYTCTGGKFRPLCERGAGIIRQGGDFGRFVRRCPE